MKTLYVHFGTPKTGTTAIQKYCMQHKEELAKEGFVYPRFKWVFSDAPKSRNAHFLIADTKNGMEDLTPKGLAKINTLFEKYDKVLISEEAIWNMQIDRKERMVRDILADGKEHGYELKVIVYLRRQDDYIASLFNQRTKENVPSSNGWTMSEFFEKPVVVQLDYYKQLKSLEKLIGKENLIVRVYEKGSFGGAKKDLLSDFGHYINMECMENYDMMPEQSIRNISLTMNLLEIKRIVNTTCKKGSDISNIFLEAANECSATKNGADKMCLLSEAERKTLEERYGEGNSQIAKEYLGKEDGILFKAPKDERETWKAENEFMLADIKRFFEACGLKSVDVSGADVKDYKELILKLAKELAKEKKATNEPEKKKANFFKRAIRKIKRTFKGKNKK